MSRNKRIAYRGCLLALALILSWLESLIPVFYGIPGIRLGISNIVTVYTLYRLSAKDACFVSLGRILLSALLFGNVMTMIYSLAGAACSLIVMLPAKSIPKLSAMGVSVLGGLFHNVGQVVMAAFLFRTGGLMTILSVLLPIGAAAGAVIGILAGILIRRVPIDDGSDEP